MKFRSTSHGISNLHFFIGVDYVVFVEGGKGYTKEEICEGRYDTNALDIKFWKTLFEMYYPDTKFQFRAIGSKETLVSISQGIIQDKISNTYVAMDRDRDNFIDRIIRSNYVLYTNGYSWENDVWNKEVVEAVFNALCGVCIFNDILTDEISQIFECSALELKKYVYVDCYLSISEESFFPKTNINACICNQPNKPKINTKYLNSILQKFKIDEKELEKFKKKCEIDTLRDCYGHLLSDLCYSIIIYLIRKNGDKSAITKKMVNSLAIEKFGQQYMVKLNPVREHYDENFSD